MKVIQLIVMLFVSTFVLRAQEKNFSEAFKLVEIWLEAQKDFENLPGISAIVVHNQEILWKGGFGEANPETGVPAKPATLYSICSISKLFTSVAIMRLYDEGKLSLDDQVQDILPWFNIEQQYQTSGPLTVRTLLTHSSGLPRESAHSYWTGPDFPFPATEEIKSKLSEQQTLYPASTYFQYSNLGLALLGEIVKEVSGTSYDEYIQDAILKPLNMMNTRTILPEDKYGNMLAIGFSSPERNRQRKKVNFFQANGIKAAAGFASNVEDHGKFASWQFRLLEGTKAEILKPSTLKYMQQVHFTDPNWTTTWGLGFSVRKDDNGNTVVGHGGSCPGYRTQLSVYPKEKLAFSVMINASGTNPSKYISGIKSIMEKMEIQKDTIYADFTEYTGIYSQQPWWSEEYIGVLNGKLVSMPLPNDSPGNSLTFFKHIGGDNFQRIREDNELGEMVLFERDENGKVIRFKQHGNFSVKVEN